MIGPTSLMLHTKSQGHQLSGFGEDFLKGFTIYGHVGHLRHVTKTICIYLGYIIKRSLHMKFEFDWPNGFGENCVLIYCWESNMSDLK